MSENNCYLCQEPKSVVGHNTQSCPNVKCKKCGQKGHIQRNCPNLNSDIDQKLINICPKEIRSEQSIVLHDDTKTLDYVHGFEFSDDSKPKLKIKIDLKRGFDLLKRKSKFKEETLTVKSSKIDQKPGQVDPIMSKEMLDFTHDIELSGDVKPKLEIKEGTLKMKNEISEKPKTTRFVCEICNVITDQAGIDFLMLQPPERLLQLPSHFLFLLAFGI